MSAVFKVGEIAILRNLLVWPEYNGMECEVIGGLQMRVGWTDRQRSVKARAPTYLVRAIEDGQLLLAGVHQLRKRGSPSDGRTVTRWEECPWQPLGAHA